MCSCVNIIIFVCFRFWIYNIFIFTVSISCRIRDCDLLTVECDLPIVGLEYTYYKVLLDYSNLNK